MMRNGLTCHSDRVSPVTMKFRKSCKGKNLSGTRYTRGSPLPDLQRTWSSLRYCCKPRRAVGWFLSLKRRKSLVFEEMKMIVTNFFFCYIESIQGYVVMVLTAAPILCIILSTLCFYTLAALGIRRIRKNEASPVDKHYKKNREW